MKVEAVIQNAFQCYCVIYDEKKKKDTTQTSLDHFSNRDDKIKSSKVSEPVPSTVSKHKIAAFRLLLLMIFQLYHLSPCLPPPASNSSCLFTQCQLLYCILLYFSWYCTIRFKMFSLIIVFFMYYLCESIINLLQYRAV